MQNIFGFFEETLRGEKTSLIQNWLGKVACEIFCFSTGKAYRSEEIVLALQQFLTLQIDFTFETMFISLPEMELYFRNKMLSGVISAIVFRRCTLSSFICACNNPNFCLAKKSNKKTSDTNLSYRTTALSSASRK